MSYPIMKRNDFTQLCFDLKIAFFLVRTAEMSQCVRVCKLITFLKVKIKPGLKTFKPKT